MAKFTDRKKHYHLQPGPYEHAAAWCKRHGAEDRIRTKLLKHGHIDTVIGFLFFSTGIPVCILVLKKCKKFDDMLFVNASEHYETGKF